MFRKLLATLAFGILFSGIPHVSVAGRKADTEIANRVAQWQIDNFGKYITSKSGKRRDQNWVNGALYRGMVVWAQTSGYQPCEDFVLKIGRRTGWSMDTRPYHADDICVGQAYLLLYEKYRDPAMLAPVKERADTVVDYPAKTKLHIKAKDGQKRWSWCDALFMAPPVYAQLSKITNDPKYLQFMNADSALSACHDNTAFICRQDLAGLLSGRAVGGGRLPYLDRYISVLRQTARKRVECADFVGDGGT